MFSTDIWLWYPKILKPLFTEENTHSPIFFHFSCSPKILKFAFSKSFTPFYCWGCFSVSVISDYYIYTFLSRAHSQVSYLQVDAEDFWKLLLAIGKDLGSCRGLWNSPCSLTRHWTMAHCTQILQMFQLEQNDIYLAGFYITLLAYYLLSEDCLDRLWSNSRYILKTINRVLATIKRCTVIWNVSMFSGIYLHCYHFWLLRKNMSLNAAPGITYDSCTQLPTQPKPISPVCASQMSFSCIQELTSTILKTVILKR